LRAQHLNAVKAVGMLTDAKVKGLQIGSKEIEFAPGPPKAGKFNVNVGTAGSTSLVLQALMPAMAFTSDRVFVEIVGGTNNPLAPAIDYLQHILLPTIEKMGYRGSIELLRRGFYPRGQGIVRAFADPVKTLNPIILKEFGHVRKIRGLSYSSRLPSHIVERMAQGAKRTLQNSGYENFEIELECLQPEHGRCAVNPGCGIILFAELSSGAVIGSDSLGKPGKPAEKVGQEAATELLKQLSAKAPVDKHLGDQLIIWISLARGTSIIHVSELTLHTITCIEVSKKIVGATFDVQGKLGEPAVITCKGIGLENKYL
jgi:RNA 3'-phosphate cyclase